MLGLIRLKYRTHVPSGLRRGIRDLMSLNLKGVKNRFKYGQVGWHSIVHALPSFYPSSANYLSFPELTLRSAENSAKILVGISDFTNSGPCPETQSKDFLPELTDDPSYLHRLLQKYGSDKSEPHIHDYHLIYSKILNLLKPKKQPIIFEIGLGTNNPELISSMGVGGSPGASLRAFRDFLPNAQVFGADIDRDILFSEDRIKTGYVDQLNPKTIEDFWMESGGKGIDLFIDDGLHAPESNLNSLMFALRHINDDGWIVIEDIGDRSLAIWKLAYRLLENSEWKAQIVKCKSSYIFVVNKKAKT